MIRRIERDSTGNFNLSEVAESLNMLIDLANGQINDELQHASDTGDWRTPATAAAMDLGRAREHSYRQGLAEGERRTRELYKHYGPDGEADRHGLIFIVKSAWQAALVKQYEDGYADGKALKNEPVKPGEIPGSRLVLTPTEYDALVEKYHTSGYEAGKKDERELHVGKNGVTWHSVADELAEAIRLTREYLGEEAMPATEAYSWYTAYTAYLAANGLPEYPEWAKRPPEHPVATIDARWPCADGIHGGNIREGARMDVECEACHHAAAFHTTLKNCVLCAELPKIVREATTAARRQAAEK